MNERKQELHRGEEFTSPDEDLLLFKYYDENFQFQYLLDSFNYCYDYEFARCLEDKVINLSRGRFAKLKHVRIEKCEYSHETALLTDQTYAGNYIVTMRIFDSKGVLLNESKEQTLMKIPIPVRSKYSRTPFTYPRDPAMEKDPGCYFVVDGIYRIVILYDKLRQNQFRLDKDRKTGEYSVKQITEVPSGNVRGSTSQSTITMKVEKSKDGSASNPIAMTNIDKKEYVGETKLSVLEMAYIAHYFLEGKDMKIGAIIKEFENLFKRIIPREQLHECWSAFSPTIHKFTQKNLIEVVEKMRSAVQGDKLNKDEEVQRVVKLGLHPNHPTLAEKLRVLITMTARLLQCYCGKIAIHDRNSWSHKGVEGPGAAIVNLFRRKFSGAILKVNAEQAVSSAEDGQAVMELFLKHDMASKFMAEFVNSPGGRAKAKGGIAGARKRKGGKPKLITQDLYLNNTLDLYLALSKTKSEVDKHSTDALARSLHQSGFRTTCGQGVTDNENCGLIRFGASLLRYTIPSDSQVVIDILLQKTFRDGSTIAKKTFVALQYTLPVFVNGLMIGYVNKDVGYHNCVLLKRYGVIDRMCCIVPIASIGVLEIYTDSYRPVRPTLIVSEETGRLALYQKKQWRNMSFSQLVKEGYVEYVDTYEFENPDLRVAQTFMSFDHQERQIRDLENMIDKAREKANIITLQNLVTQLKYAKKYRITHADLHPVAGYGIVGSIVTFLANQQACRSAFEQKMLTQDISTLLNNPYSHTENYTSVYGFSKMLDSGVTHAMGTQDLQGGTPVIIAFIPDQNNQEDAAIINKDAIDIGLFRYWDTAIFKDKTESAEQQFGRVSSSDIHPSAYRHINPNGLPSIGAILRPHDAIICKYETQMMDSGQNIKRDKSTYLDSDHSGVVKEVVTYENNKAGKRQENSIVVKVRFDAFDRLEAGNKISLGHAQKFVTSVVRQGVDMPFIPERTIMVENVRKVCNLPISVIVNPLCFVTRMTTGTLAVPLIMKANTGSGRIYNASAHRRHNYVELQNLLLANGFSYDGTDICYDGITGEPIEAPIMIGPNSVSMLKHIAKKKIQCRSIGTVDKNSRQAKASRKGIAKDKGQKFSEYERVSALKAGALSVIDERMNVSSDAYTIVVCRNCSSYASFNPETRQFNCKECMIEKKELPQGKAFGKYMFPYTSRYQQALLLTLGIDLKVKFVGKEEYLGTGQVIQENDEGYFEGDELEGEGEDSNQDPDDLGPEYYKEDY